MSSLQPSFGSSLGVLTGVGAVAEIGYRGILRAFVKTGAPDNGLRLEGTVSVGGLGGNPYRDGSYQYYLSEKS